MANIAPEIVLGLVNELLGDSDNINNLARTMPGKIQRMEEGAQGLRSVGPTTENFQQAMQALQQVAQNLDDTRQFLNSLAQQMEDLINR